MQMHTLYILLVSNKKATYHPKPPKDTLLLLLSILSDWTFQQSPSLSGSPPWEMYALLSVSLSILCWLSLCLSLSLCVPLSLSLSLASIWPLFFPLLSCSPLFFDTRLPGAAVFHFATWPVNYFPETLACSLAFTGCSNTHLHAHAQSDTLKHTGTLRYTQISAGGGARWGGATTSHLTLCVCFQHTHTHTQSQSCYADAFGCLNHFYHYNQPQHLWSANMPTTSGHLLCCVSPWWVCIRSGHSQFTLTQ